MADQDPRIEMAIRNSLSRVDASSAEVRQSVYAAAFRSLDRQLRSRGEEHSERARVLHEKLAATISTVDDSYVTPLLVEGLDGLSLDLSDMSDAATKSDQMTNPDQPIHNSSGTDPRRMLLWSVGLLLVAGAIGTFIYILSNDQSPSSTASAVAYEATPPFPLVYGETFAASLNNAAKFVTISNTSARTDQSGLLPSVTISSEIEEKLSGKTIEVSISARASAGATAAQLEAIYYTVGVGNSGPRTFPLGPDYSDVTFTYDVPTRVGEPGVDYLGVAPASPDANASIDVRSVQIRLKPAQ